MSPATTQSEDSTRRSSASVKLSGSTSLAPDASPSDPEVLRTLYAMLVKTRLLEEQVLRLSRSGKFPGSPVPLLGGEATEVGACIGLQPDDSFSSTQPRLATHVVRGTPLPQVFVELLPTSTASPAAPLAVVNQTVRILPQPNTIAGQLNIAAGVALAYRNLGRSNVVVALVDNGLAALGFWHEAARLASNYRLPIVFMIENCALSHPGSASPVYSGEDLRDRAEAYGIPGITVDGNDIVAVWRVTQESIYRARTGAGPTLIECRTWRWHASPAGLNGSGRSLSRPPQARWQNDPLHHMEHYMKKRKLWNQAWSDKLAENFRRDLEAAIGLRRSRD